MIALMFPALFALIFLGIPVSFALIAVAAGAGFLVFDGNIVRTASILYGKALGSASSPILASIPLFIFMGAVMERSAIARRLFAAMQLWLGRMPGGLAVATIAMCAVFAAASGIIGAVETVIGMMAVPPMLKYGYDKGLISGTICAGGSLGTIIPPSVTVIIYASISELSIGDLYLAITIPGLITVGVFLAYIIGLALLKPGAAPRLPRSETDLPLKVKLMALVTGVLPAAALITAVLGSIILGIAAPTEAAAVGAGGALLLALAYGELNRAVMIEICRKAVSISAMVMMIVVGGGMFSSMFLVGGGRGLVANGVTALNMGPEGLMLVFLLIVFILGFVLDWITIILITLPVFLAPLKAAGVDQIWFSVLMICVIQTSYLTPPMAPAIFYFRTIAPPEITYRHMYRGITAFVLLEMVVLAVVWFLPGTATYLPYTVTRF